MSEDIINFFSQFSGQSSTINLKKVLLFILILINSRLIYLYILIHINQ